MSIATPPPGFSNFHRHTTVDIDTELNELRLAVKSGDLNESVKKLLHSDEEAQDKWKDDSEFKRAALDYLDSSIEFRTDLRPTSLRNVSDFPEQVSRHTRGGWAQYWNAGDATGPKVPTSEGDETAHGKYLFFSPNVSVLENILLDQFALGPFRSTKIPTLPNQRGDDFVLCLYYEDDRFRYYLAGKYGNQQGLKYQYFKVDEATHRGEYSEKFLSLLSEGARDAFEGEK